MTYGAAIYDFDNDGWLDILASAGPLHGDFPISSQPSEQPDVLLRGGPDGFTDVSVEQGVDDLQAGRGVAVGLLDDDGMMEAVVTHLDSPTRLFRPTAPPTEHWWSICWGMPQYLWCRGACGSRHWGPGAIPRRPSEQRMGQQHSSSGALRFGGFPVESCSGHLAIRHHPGTRGGTLGRWSFCG